MNKLPEVILFTRFPFGFFRKWIKLDMENEEMLVYPNLEDVYINEGRLDGKWGEKKAQKRGFGTSLRSLRRYQSGDSPKFIHWKITAKTGELMLREFHDDESKRARVEFRPDRSSERELELSITRAASTLVSLLEKDYEVEFITPDRVFSPSQIGRSPRPVLRYLALFN